MSTVKSFHYTDPIVETQLRAYADDRGFAQLTIARAHAPQNCIAVRIRDDELDTLISVLVAARELAEGSDRND